MTQNAALRLLHQITAGIDLEESASDAGWWETSAGAARGADVLRQLEDLIRQVT